MVQRGLVTVMAALMLFFLGNDASAANRVVVESKTVAANQTGVQIRILIENDVPIRTVVIPLEIMTSSGSASIATIHMSFEDRLASYLTESQWLNDYPNDDGFCKLGNPGGYGTIGGHFPGAPIVVSSMPEGCMASASRIIGANLPAGADATGSILLTFDIGPAVGTITIDTTCANPANHLVFAPASGSGIYPEFVAGNITVRNCQPDTTWVSVASSPDDWIDDIIVYNDKLIVGGAFTHVGLLSANHIAAWDGANWSPLLGGVDGWVLALAVWNGKLVAGGSFSQANGIPARRIAAWNGYSWDSLGTGLNNTVYGLAVYNGQLIASGDFDSAGGVAANHIAAWNGASWQPLRGGLDGSATMQVWNSKLVVGGSFLHVDGIWVPYIATWDGSSWSATPPAMNNQVHSLCVFNNKLVAGGWFTAAGGVSASHAAMWDGVNWAPLGTGTGDETIWDMEVFEGRLYAGGNFRYAGGVSADRIAVWNGQQWGAVGFGFDNSVNSFALFGGKLYAAGHFVADGSGASCPNSYGCVAKLTTKCCTGRRGNVNMTGITDLSDLSALVSYLTGGGYSIPCEPTANVNGVGIVDLSDLSALVSYLTGGGYVLPSCP